MPGRYDAGGYHGPAVVNHYYRGGCWNCTGRGGEAAAASAVGLAAGATIGAPVALPYYPVGTLVVAKPPDCHYQLVDGSIITFAVRPGSGPIGKWSLLLGRASFLKDQA
jgi:hypothetical protein